MTSRKYWEGLIVIYFFLFLRRPTVSSAKVTSLTTKPLKEFQPVFSFSGFLLRLKYLIVFLEGKRAPPFYFFRLTRPLVYSSIIYVYNDFVSLGVAAYGS